jgi:hypothetical protein
MESTAPSRPSLSHGSDTLAQEATVRSLMSRDLAGDPAKELLMIAVEYDRRCFNPTTLTAATNPSMTRVQP